MTNYIDNIEAVIGPSSDLIVTDENRKNLILWAEAKHRSGMAFPPGAADDAERLSNPELANLYHAHGLGAKPAGPSVDGPVARFFKALTETGYAPLDAKRVIGIADKLVGERLSTVMDLMVDQIAIELDKLPKFLPVKIELIERNDEVRQLEGLHHAQTPEVINIVRIGDPVMLVGPAGCGKTTIGEMTAKALSLPFYITSTVFDTHELMGFVDGAGHYHRTPFREAFENGGVWVADEIDAWDAAALLAANSALANGYVTFPDSTASVKRHDNFRMIACANTFGKGADRVYVGRNQLDAASLDRFAVIAVDYDRALEMALSNGNVAWTQYVWRVRDKVEARNIRHVVSTRAIAKGSRAISQDVSWSRAADIYLFKGMPEADRKKVDDPPGV